MTRGSSTVFSPRGAGVPVPRRFHIRATRAGQQALVRVAGSGVLAAFATSVGRRSAGCGGGAFLLRRLALPPGRFLLFLLLLARPGGLACAPALAAGERIRREVVDVDDGHRLFVIGEQLLGLLLADIAGLAGLGHLVGE